jgi:Zn-dependent peptidase ImmA (M78 family)/transcriptional regulator with XRE-family HTH domain
MDRVNPEMLELARDSRGLTQSALASLSGVDQGNISKYERGLLDISDTALEKIAAALRYPRSFFYRFDEVRGIGSGCFYHRRKQSLPVTELRVIQARANILRLQAAILLRGAEIDHDNRIVRRDIGDGETAEDIARYVRATWESPLGPIRNLVRVIERAGGIVFRCHFGTNRLDAVSQWSRDLPPIMFVNADAPNDRARWSLAHELGHIIMHRIPSDDAEREADRFASEFLLPAREIAADLNHFNLTRAAMLKPYWGVSMAALVMKAHTLEKISDWQKTNLFRQLSQANMRTKEPDTVAAEKPTVMTDLINLHCNELGYSVQQLAALLHLEEDEFKSLYLSDTDNWMGLRVFR